MCNLQNIAIICLGANTPDASLQIDRALHFISAHGKTGKNSGQYRTAPEYAGESTPYLNEVLELHTHLDYKSLQHILKKYETGIRITNNHVGLVNLDIDIVYWNGMVLRPKDASAAYFRTGINYAGL